MGIASVLALAIVAASPAQTPPTCPQGPAPLPAELSGWAAMTPVTAAAEATGAAALTVGQGARATLAPAATLRFGHPPQKPIEPGTYGGLFALTVTRGGRYRVALGAGAWIDIVADARAVPSIAHSHGPACSPIRKMVDFDLAPGRYVVQIAGAKTSTLPLIVASVPR